MPLFLRASHHPTQRRFPNAYLADSSGFVPLRSSSRVRREASLLVIYPMCVKPCLSLEGCTLFTAGLRLVVVSAELDIIESSDRPSA